MHLLQNVLDFKHQLDDSAPKKAKKRRNKLIDVSRKAVRTAINCETWTTSLPVLRGIKDLGGIFLGRSQFISLNRFYWRPRKELCNSQEILVVAQPGIVYVVSMTGDFGKMRDGALKVVGAKVIPAYVEEEGTATAVAEDEINTLDDVDEESGEDGTQTEDDGNLIEGQGGRLVPTCGRYSPLVTVYILSISTLKVE
ncbi:hypothetical protein BJX62DRAFT_238360 [Aspergillus germanicus]